MQEFILVILLKIVFHFNIISKYLDVCLYKLEIIVMSKNRLFAFDVWNNLEVISPRLNNVCTLKC